MTGFPDAPPVKAGVAIADFMAGVHMYGGIVSALWRRERTGEGSLVEVAMFDAALPSLLSSLAMALGTDDERPTRTGNRHGGMGEAPYNVYPTADGGHVAIICVSDRQWRALGEVVGGRPLADDARFATRARPRRQRRRARRGRHRLHERAGARRGRRRAAGRGDAGGAGARAARGRRGSRPAPARRAAAGCEDPVRGPLRVFSSPIRYDGREPAPARPAPALGEHTEEVLREWSLGPSATGGRRRGGDGRRPRPAPPAGGAPVSGIGMRGAWRALDEEQIAAVGGHMGVYEIASGDGEVVLIGYAGGRSQFGLRGELRTRLAEPGREGARFRYEITTAYLSRYKELLMVHVAHHGSVPRENLADAPQLGRLSPS